MIIGGFQKFTLIDYPGKLSSIVFLSGCNFRCPFCYSRELVLPEYISEHPQISKETVIDYLKKRIGMLEGVVICGGEPTLNSDLKDFCSDIKKMGYCIKLDTNGSNPEALKDLIGSKLIDYVAMDIKAPLNSESYRKAVGVDVSIEKIKESIEMIKSSGIEYEFRTTVVPGIHSEEDIISMAKAIAPAKRYFIQQFISQKDLIDNSFKNTKPFPYAKIESVLAGVINLFDVCKIR
ncbi:MAG: anaerobic ribonucleoside-triphosphate reductase activating protein [Candidatus Paceibacterota bacterium]